MSALKNKSKSELIEIIESLEMQVQEFKSNEDILLRSEEKFSKTFNSSPGPMIISEIETGNIIDVNRSFANMIMYSREELIGKNVLELNLWVNPKDREKYIKKMRDDKGVSNLEIELRTKSGDIIATLISGEILTIKDKPYLLTSGRDITEHKRAKEELIESKQMLNDVLNTIPVRVFWKDLDGVYLGCNQMFAGDAGRSFPEEVIGDNDYNMGWAEQAELYRSDDRLVMESGQPKINYEEPQTTPEGKTIWLRTSKIPLWNNTGDVYGVLGTYEDITERKQAEVALQESEEKFRRLAENSPDIIYRHRLQPNPGFEYISPAVTKISGYTPEEHYNDPELGFKIIHPDDKPDLDKLATGKFSNSPHISRWIHKNGTIVWIEDKHSPVYDAEGKLSAIEGVARDITERQLAEDALKEQSYQNQQILETTLDGYILADTEGKIIDVNPAYCDMIGYSWEELLKMNIREVEVKTSPEEVNGRIQQLVRMGGDSFETKHKHKDGHILDLDASTSIMYLDDNPSVAAFVRDITESKRAEDALRESERKFREMADLLPLIVYEIDINANLTFSNKQASAIFGYSEHDLMSNFKMLDRVIPEDRDRARENMKKIMNGKSLSNTEYTMIKKDGSTFPALVNSNPVLNDNKPVGLRGIIVDISERKLAENIIKESQQRLSSHLNNTPLGSIFWDIDFNVIEWNSSAEKIFGYSKEEALGKHPYKLIVPREIQGQIDDVFNHLLTQTGGTRSVNENVTKEGNRILCDWYNVAITDFDGKVTGVASLVDDITERKDAEEALRESERRLSTLMSNLPGMAYRCRNDTSWTMEFISDGGYSLTGYHAEDFVDGAAVSYAELIHPEDRQMVWDDVQEALEKKQPFQLTYRITTASGEEKWVWEKGQAIYGTENDVISLEGFITDITEGKKAEKKLRNSHNQLRSLAERLQMIREEERATVAREIHDDLGQTLTALKMDIAWMKKNAGMTEEMRAAKFDTMLGLTDSSIQTVKRIATELRPGILDDLGLISAIEWEAEEFQKRSDIECNLVISVEELDVNENITVAVFRIFQESLTNIARHSGATKVEVTIKKTGGLLQMEITDNGVGISEEQIYSSKSLGLIGMNERVSVFRGKLTISRAAEGGTAVRVYIPIEKT